MTKKIEKVKSPVAYSYEVYNIEGKKHIRFSSEVVYPIETIDFILKKAKKEKLKEDSTLIGIGLIIPKFPHLQIRKRKNGQKRKK